MKSHAHGFKRDVADLLKQKLLQHEEKQAACASLQSLMTPASATEKPVLLFITTKVEV